VGRPKTLGGLLKRDRKSLVNTNERYYKKKGEGKNPENISQPGGHATKKRTGKSKRTVKKKIAAVRTAKGGLREGEGGYRPTSRNGIP